MRRSPGRIRALALAGALALVATPAVARAQAGAAPAGGDSAAGHEPAAPAAVPQRATADSALEAQTRAVSAQLRCPVCQGLSLADSPSELSQEMKDVVRDQLAAGKSPDEVKAYFVAKYGEWILLQPEASGFNLVVYLLPVVALLVGGLVIVVGVRKWTRGGSATQAEHASEHPSPVSPSE